MLKKYSSTVEVKKSLLPLLYEIQTEESTQAVLGTGEVLYKGAKGPVIYTTPFQHFALGYCVAHSKCTLRLVLRLNNPENVEMSFLGVTSQCQVSSRIRNLNFWGSKLQGSIEHLRKLPLSGTQNLNLSYCGLNRESLQILGQLIVSGMNSLKHLDISRNPVCAGGTVELLQTLSIIKNLHTLNLSRLTLDCDDIRALAPLVAPQKGSLSELIIGSGKMERTAVEKMTTTILAESSLQSLSIKYIDVQLSTASLAQLLEKNPNLQTWLDVARGH